MSSTLRFSRGFLAAIITLCVFFTCLPFSRTVRADGEPTVYYAYATEDDANNVRMNQGSLPAGSFCVAVYVDNGGSQFPFEIPQVVKDSYNTGDPDSYQIPVIANNALIDAGSLYDLEYILFGSGKVQFNGYGVYSDANNAYTGEITVDGIFSHFDSLGGDDLKDSYSAIVFGNMTVKSPTTFKDVIIGNSGKLTVTNNGDFDHVQLDADKLTITGTGKLEIAAGKTPEEPNGIRIKKELNAVAGSVTGAEGSVLELDSGAAIKGGIQLYGKGGTTVQTGEGGFANVICTSNVSYTYRISGFDSARWVEDGEPEPDNDPGIYVAFNDYLFSSFTYQYGNGQSQDVPLDGFIAPDANADTITLTFVPKSGTLSVKQGDLTPTVTNNSFTLNKSDFDWTKGPCFVEVTATRPNGIYFHCDDGLVDEIDFEMGESAGFQVSGDYIAPSVYENATSIMFHVVTNNESDAIATYISTDGGLTLGTGPFQREFEIYKNGDSWADVYDVFIRHGEKKYPGMYLNYDRENSPVEKIEYSINDGPLTEVEDYCVKYDLYENYTKVKFVLTPKQGVDNLDVRIDWDQNYIGSTTPLSGFTFENNEIVITKPENATEWGAVYEIGINPVNGPQPQETFNIEFPDSTDVVRNIEYTTDDPNSSTANWRPATRDENGGRYYIDAEKQWTAINVRFVPCDHVNDVDVRFESLAQSGAEPVEINGIPVNNNMFTLVKPHEEGNDVWAYGYIVTITAKNNTPTPTPDPNSDILEKVEGHGFAYYTDKTSFSEKAADLKNCVATEIYCYFTVSNTHDYPTFADLLNNLNCISNSVEAADDEVGLPYVEFTLTFGPLTTAPFKVYILDSATKFIIKTCVDKRNVDDPKDDAYVYTVVEPGEYSNGIANQLTVRMNYLEQPTVFGNGVSTINSETNNEGNIVLHVTQDQSNINLHFADTPEHELFPTNSVGKINSYLTIEKYEIKTLNAAIAGTKLLITGTTSGSKTGDPVYVAVYKDAEKIASGLFSAGSDQSHSFSGEISIAGHGITNPSQIRVYASDREDGVMVTGTVEVAAVVAGYNIRLDGYVGVSYWLTLSSAVEELEPSVTFAYDSQVNELKSQTVSFTDSSVVTVGNVSYRVYSCKVASPEMTCAISATLTYGNTSIALESKTARQIVKNYADNQGNSELLKGLARKILNYGYYSQKYFRPDLTLNNEDDAGLDPIPSNLEGPAIPQQLPEGIQYSSTGVVFNSGNKIKFYFTIDSGVTPVITLDGGNANLVASGQRYYVYLDQISIAELGRNIVVSINGECTFTYSVLNYIALVRDSDKVDENAKKVVQALYMYYLAAEAYGTSTEA